MLITEPGAPEAGYQALAIVESLINVLIEKGTLQAGDLDRILTASVQKLSKPGSSVRNNSARLISERMARRQEFK
jgi:hypothetical protein